MMIHPRLYGAGQQRDPLPADSGEWPRVRIKYRRLPAGTPRPGVARHAVAVAAGIVAWPLPLLLWYAGAWEVAWCLLVFPLHTGMAVSLVAGCNVSSHDRFMFTLQSLFAGAACIGVAALVILLVQLRSPSELWVVPVGAFYLLMLVLVSAPGALIGSYFGGCLMKRLFRAKAEPEQQPVQNKLHAGAVPYYYPRTQSRPRHG